MTSKGLLPLINPHAAAKLLDIKIGDLSLYVGMITGRVALNKHLHKIGLRSEPDCNCGHLAESSTHFLCECPTFSLLKLATFGKYFCKAADISSLNPLAIQSFAKASERFR